MPALPGMEAFAATTQADQKDEGDIAKRKGQFEKCEKHSRPFEYWVKDIHEFYCVKCATENPPIELELVEDALLQIKAALEAKIPIAEKKVQEDMEALDERHAELVGHRNSIRKFIKALEALDGNLNREIEEVAGTRSEALDTVAELRDMKRKLAAFKTTSDLHVAVECKSTLKRAAVPSTIPTSDLPRTLLCNIAHSYVVSWG